MKMHLLNLTESPKLWGICSIYSAFSVIAFFACRRWRTLIVPFGFVGAALAMYLVTSATNGYHFGELLVSWLWDNRPVDLLLLIILTNAALFSPWMGAMLNANRQFEATGLRVFWSMVGIYVLISILSGTWSEMSGTILAFVVRLIGALTTTLFALLGLRRAVRKS